MFSEIGDLNPIRSTPSNNADCKDGGLFAQAFVLKDPPAADDKMPRLDLKQQGVVDGFAGLPTDQAATRLRQYLEWRVNANPDTAQEQVIQRELDQLNPHLQQTRGKFYFHVGMVKGKLTVADVQDRVKLQIKTKK